MTHTLFISDLHLQKNEPQITAIFLDFMENRAPKADALYILGDFFEVWIGDDDRSNFNQHIIQVLQQLSEVTPIYFMRGNRDLLIGKIFAKTANISLLNDPCVINLYDKPILLTHGDILCTLDKRHQAYRKKVTQPWLQKLFLCTPLRFRKKLVRHLRQRSREYNLNTPSHIMDVTPEAVERMMKENETSLLIHGHTHQPKIHDVNIKNAKRIVLGSWHKKGSALVYHDDGSFELESF